MKHFVLYSNSVLREINKKYAQFLEQFDAIREVIVWKRHSSATSKKEEFFSETRI
jgi:hypothetical protein